ncbi:MAG: hypothetical protein WAO19_08385, partial [Candidatus Kryptoniota bacterium]
MNAANQISSQVNALNSLPGMQDLQLSICKSKVQGGSDDISTFGQPFEALMKEFSSELAGSNLVAKSLNIVPNAGSSLGVLTSAELVNSKATAGGPGGTTSIAAAKLVDTADVIP